MTTGLHLAPTARRRAAAALAAVVALAVGLVISLDGNAGAVPTATPAAVRLAAPAPSTTSAGGVTLTVTPASGLTPAGGTLTVAGSGFKTTGGLYVAICHANGKAPASFADCVGGAIPDSNPTTSWAHITTDGTPAAGGSPVVAKWGNGGTFSVGLTLPASNPASDALDCSKVVCAVYTKPDTGTDATQNLSIPLTYQAVVTTTPSSSTTSSSTAITTTTTSSKTTTSQQISTSTIAGPPTTVQPKTIKSESVPAGGRQQVLFAGFTKGEIASVTLYSDPIKMNAVRADGDGVVNINFVVPADLPIGTHLLRVVGQTSKVVGIASFQVTSAVVSSAVVSSAPASTPVSSAASSSAVSSAPASSAVVLPTVESTPVSYSAPVTSASAAPVVPAASSGSKRPIWPWFVLGIVILLWIGFAVFMLVRRRRRLAAEMAEKERILAEGAAAEQERAAGAIAVANADAPTSYIGPLPGESTGYQGYHPGEHGLLSGRDNPDNPGLLSGQAYRTGPDPRQDLPTTFLPPGPGPSYGGPADPTQAIGQPSPGQTGAFGQPGVGQTGAFGQPGQTGAFGQPGSGPTQAVGQPWQGAPRPPEGFGGPPTGAWSPDFTPGATGPSGVTGWSGPQAPQTGSNPATPSGPLTGSGPATGSGPSTSAGPAAGAGPATGSGPVAGSNPINPTGAPTPPSQGEVADDPDEDPGDRPSGGRHSR